MLNIKEIFEGWRNDLIPPKDLKEIIEQMHKERMEICNACDKNSFNAIKEGYRTIRPDVHCIECGCPLSKKTKSPSSECPLKKWTAFITKEEQNKLNNEQDTERHN